MKKSIDDINKTIARRVLVQAARTEGFFDLCDAERLVSMLCLAAKLGAADERRRLRKIAQATPGGTRALDCP